MTNKITINSLQRKSYELLSSCSLSAPSSLFTASTKRSWSSTVHLNLGLFTVALPGVEGLVDFGEEKVGDGTTSSEGEAWGTGMS